jgi:hypothetical protein
MEDTIVLQFTLDKFNLGKERLERDVHQMKGAALIKIDEEKQQVHIILLKKPLMSCPEGILFQKQLSTRSVTDETVEKYIAALNINQ